MATRTYGADFWFQTAFLTWASAAVLGLVILLILEKSKTVWVSHEGWMLAVRFFQNDRPEEREVSRNILNDPRNIFWRSWSPETQAAKGRVGLWHFMRLDS